MTITLHDIQQAAQHIGPGIVHTPGTHSAKLSQRLGLSVTLKFENLQFTGSFKDRGALYKLLSLSPGEREQGVVAMSSNSQFGPSD